MEFSTPFHEHDGVPSSAGHPLNCCALILITLPPVCCFPRVPELANAPFVVGQGPRSLDLPAVALPLVVDRPLGQRRCSVLAGAQSEWGPALGGV
jgi:hypothetical protein